MGALAAAGWAWSACARGWHCTEGMVDTLQCCDAER